MLEELSAIGSDGELTALGRHMVSGPDVDTNFFSALLIDVLLGDVTDGSPPRKGKLLSVMDVTVGCGA